MTDYETMLSILNKSNYMKDHFDHREVEVCNPDGTTEKRTVISLREWADQVDLDFDENGSIL